MDVTVGAEPTTYTVLDTCVAELLAASVHEKVKVYVPAVLVSTEPEVTIWDVMSPSVSSMQVAPESVYVESTLTDAVAEPTSVSTGGVVSAVAVTTYDWSSPVGVVLDRGLLEESMMLLSSEMSRLYVPAWDESAVT